MNTLPELARLRVTASVAVDSLEPRAGRPEVSRRRASNGFRGPGSPAAERSAPLLLLLLALAILSACTANLIGKRTPLPVDQQESMATVLAAEEVTVSIDALRFGKIKLVALGESLTMLGDADLGTADGVQRWRWKGRVVGDELSQAVLASRGTSMFGFVRTSDGLVIELRPTPTGKHVIRKLDGQTFVPEGLPVSQSAQTAAFAVAKCPLPQNDVVNVAVYYTDRARTKLGTDDAIRAAIDASILNANQAYVDSQVRVRLNLLEAKPTTYVETTSLAALNAMTNPADGQLDELPVERNTLAADAVILVAETDSCGRAFQLTRMPDGNAAYAYAVVHPDCFVNLGLVHEMGHIMGAHHDAYVAGNDPVPYPYAHGWVDLQMKRVSIMAYGTECREKKVEGCVGVGRFSNPNQFLGNAGTADNHQVLNDTAETVSSYRCSPTNPITLGSRFVSTTMVPSDNMGNFWYLDRREQPVEVVFENLGDSPWDSSYALQLVVPDNNLNTMGGQLLDVTRVPLGAGEVVNPGQQKKFTFVFIGQGRADNFQWQMTDGSGAPFGDKTPRVTLQPKGF